MPPPRVLRAVPGWQHKPKETDPRSDKLLPRRSLRGFSKVKRFGLLRQAGSWDAAFATLHPAAARGLPARRNAGTFPPWCLANARTAARPHGTGPAAGGQRGSPARRLLGSWGAAYLAGQARFSPPYSLFSSLLRCLLCFLVLFNLE